MKRNSPRAGFFRRPIDVPITWPSFGGTIIVDCAITRAHRAKRPEEWDNAFLCALDIDPATIQWPATSRHVGVMTSHLYDKTFNLQLVQALFSCGCPEVRVIRVDGPSRTCVSQHYNLPESAVRSP